MRALVWHGPKNIRVETVPDPKILTPTDAILKVTTTAICGSDLHLYKGVIPSLKSGDILGHEFMGEIVEVGEQVNRVKVGDRVVVPFAIACGGCYFCRRSLFACCDNSNPNALQLEKLTGYSTAGMFGYSHLYGGYAGGQAEYVRVPYADTGAYPLPRDGVDEKYLFLSDILPTGYMAAMNADIGAGDTVAVWGAGPVGLMAMKCARLLGAERVIAIDRFENRLTLAKEFAAAEPVNYETIDNITDFLREMTAGRGPDACIDAVGMEAHESGVAGTFERAKQNLGLETDSPVVLRDVIRACRKGGTLSVPGVYGGVIDKFPMGIAFAKGLTFRMGQTHVHRYLDVLLGHIQKGDIKPEGIISHTLGLENAVRGYEIFRNKEENCTKVVLKP